MISTKIQISQFSNTFRARKTCAIKLQAVQKAVYKREGSICVFMKQKAKDER